VDFPAVHEQTEWVPFGVPLICKTKEAKHELVNYLETNGIQTRNYFADSFQNIN
jgi:hypothetical protein